MNLISFTCDATLRGFLYYILAKSLWLQPKHHFTKYDRKIRICPVFSRSCFNGNMEGALRENVNAEFGRASLGSVGGVDDSLCPIRLWRIYPHVDPTKRVNPTKSSVKLLSSQSGCYWTKEGKRGNFSASSILTALLNGINVILKSSMHHLLLFLRQSFYQ